MTTVLVNEVVVELSTIVVVVSATEDAEDVREFVEDAVVEINGVDEVDVSTLVEVAKELDVDVTSVDDAVVRAEDVRLVDVSDVSELTVLEDEVSDDVEVEVWVEDVTDDSVDERDVPAEDVCDSSVEDATESVVDTDDGSEVVTDSTDENVVEGVVVELSIWRSVVADAV
jgi:hypothetical protein